MDRKSLRGSLLLLLGSVIWGAAFVAQRVGMDHVGPYTFNGVRMLLHTEGGPVEYRIWSSDPKDYDSPLREVDSPNPGTWICGYETRLEPGCAVTLVTTLKRL